MASICSIQPGQAIPLGRLAVGPAAFMALAPFADPGEISVGTAINIEHRAPTGIGAKVKAEAVLESTDGRFYVFRVTAHNGHKEIGRGTVTRAFVNPAKVAEKHAKA